MRAPLSSVPGGPKVMRPRMTRGLVGEGEGMSGILAGLVEWN